MKTLKTLAVLPLGLVLAYGATSHFAPGLAAELRGMIRASQQWSQEAVQSDPVGFLKATRSRLIQERARLGDVVQELRLAIGPLEGHIDERLSELARTEAFLREGRAIYQQAVSTGTQDGILFASRRYPDLQTFKTQLELLFSEKADSEQLLEQLRATRERINDRLAASLLQAGKLDTAIQEIGPQIAIVSAEHSVKETEQTIAAGRRLSQGMLIDTARMIEEFPIATTRELLETTPRGRSQPIANNPTFAAYLNAEG